MITLSYDALIFALTLAATSAYAVLVWVFFRIPGNRIIRAMMWYFLAMFLMYALALMVENGFSVGLGDKWWAEWRALFFRGSQAVASIWLLVAITRR